MKRMLTKGYSVPQDFSWIENYKLICQKKVGLNFRWPKFCHPWKLRVNKNFRPTKIWAFSYRNKICI